MAVVLPPMASPLPSQQLWPLYQMVGWSVSEKFSSGLVALILKGVN